MKSANSAIDIQDYLTALERYDKLDKQVAKIGLQAVDISVYKGLFQYARSFIAHKKGEDPLPYLQAMMRHFKKALPNLEVQFTDWRKARGDKNLAALAQALPNAIQLLNPDNEQHADLMGKMLELSFAVEERFCLIKSDSDMDLTTHRPLPDKLIADADREAKLQFYRMEARYLHLAYDKLLPDKGDAIRYIRLAPLWNSELVTMNFDKIGMVAFRLANLANKVEGYNAQTWIKMMLGAFRIAGQSTPYHTEEGASFPTMMRCLRDAWKISKKVSPAQVVQFAQAQQALHENMGLKRDDFPKVSLPPISKEFVSTM